jgi:hypothetical protein
MKGREIAIGAIFVVMFFIGLAFVPLGMCNDNAVEEWAKPDASNAEVITAPISSDNAIKELEEWIQDHTVKVTITTTYKYEEGHLLIKEVYTGEELKARIGVEQLTNEFRIPAESNKVGMEEGEEKIFVTEKEKLITLWEDPLPWWDVYDYPQWTWSKKLIWAVSEDPINLAWENTNIDRVRNEILEEPNWVTISSYSLPIPQQHEHYVYDPGFKDWIPGEGVADDAWGLRGRYHVRLWQMSWQMFDGDVVANAHHDSLPPHRADQYEEAEELVAGFFTDSEWKVYKDSYWLDNPVDDPWNSGKCTQIYYFVSAEVYVPDDYPTIQAAVDAVNAGDTIIVRDGTYTENVNVNKPHLTIQSENGADSG